ncbi:MAG: long-chain fatty acid--CoA ligase [Deltaproteobacteria bacterium]|nr:long-chain fatty acid--CoA ligase [Deltaproteobacteria bacterium]
MSGRVRSQYILDVSLPHLLANWAERTPNHEAQCRRAETGETVTTTWAGYWLNVRAIAKGLIALGLQAGTTVAIWAANRAEWVWCELAIMAAGATVVPIYPTSTEEQVRYILEHANARWVIADQPRRIAMLSDREGPLSGRLDHVIDLDGSSAMSLDQLMRHGDAIEDAILDERLNAVQASSDAPGLIIYTSGTTGTPKGVELSHRNMTTVARSVAEDYGPILSRIELRALSYLPLSHIAEQVFTVFLHLTVGGRVYYCPNIDDLRLYLPWARPTVFLGVPRVWEKIESAVRARLESASPPRAALARWAMRVESQAASSLRRTSTGREPDGDPRVEPHRQPNRVAERFARHVLPRVARRVTRRIANQVVLSKIRRTLGFEDLALAGSGAAPISVDTLDFFASLGIRIHEAYGMTETTGVLTLSSPDRPIFGTVGRALRGVELKIASDGEICARGPTMTRAYHRDPESTRALIDDEGWLHTGDLGALDEDGNLRIVGRKKEMIITAGGKNVAPVEIEQYLVRIRGISQAVVIGDRRPYLTALLTLDLDDSDELRTAAGFTSQVTAADLTHHPAVRAVIEARLEAECNRHLARYQTIKNFALLAETFSVERGELTPSLKLKRATIHERHREVIASLYGSK